MHYKKQLNILKRKELVNALEFSILQSGTHSTHFSLQLLPSQNLKENYPISAFAQSLFPTKKIPKVVNLPLTNEMLFEFLTPQTEQVPLPIFKAIMR